MTWNLFPSNISAFIFFLWTQIRNCVQEVFIPENSWSKDESKKCYFENITKRTFLKDGQKSKDSCKRWWITENIFPNSLKNILVENLGHTQKKEKKNVVKLLHLK